MIETDQSRYVAYAGRKLERGVPCHWSVRIWNEKKDASAWSSPGLWTVFDMKQENGRVLLQVESGKFEITVRTGKVGDE
jgi:hypothetical protein